MTDIFSHIRFLNDAASATRQNHSVISENLANVNTPHCKTKRVDFEQILEHLESARSGGHATMPIDVTKVDGLPERIDGNNVSLESKLSELKKNALAAEVHTRLLASQPSTMRRAISG